MGWRFPRVFAHRGGGTLAPENTLAGMAAGVAHGYRAVEFDVMLTSDEVPILMHDPTFGRTIAGRGSVSKTSAAKLAKLDAGAWFDAAFDGERVPTLIQVLNYCTTHGVFMNLEIKPAPRKDLRTAEIVAATCRDFLAANGEPDNILFSSFSAQALAVAQRVAPKIPRGYLLHRLKGHWQAQIEQLECIALHCNHELVDDKLMAEMRARELGVFCYTVNSLKRAQELRQLGVDAFCTDRIDLIAADFFQRREALSA